MFIFGIMILVCCGEAVHASSVDYFSRNAVVTISLEMKHLNLKCASCSHFDLKCEAIMMKFSS